MFRDIFGDNPTTKILDFLASHVKFDYTITDIAKYSEVSKPTVYKVLDTLLKKKIVIITREMGNSSMYKLNTNNPIVKKILNWELEISKYLADIESDKSLQQYKPILVKGSQPRIA